MSEELLIKHCSPTLAGMKTGSLVNCSYECYYELQCQMDRLNHMLNPKGVHIVPLRITDSKALIYVYRPAKLASTISCDEVKEFLMYSGYRGCNTEYCIKLLAARLKEYEEFPHEIGLFLGYPLCDVKAFIENKGKNCKYVGCWKVYSDECNAV
ncbi:MAG: DUF3793 family protein, partial [Ruminiclostridium sp.]